MSKALSMSQRKALGAFYTDETIASFLVQWALRQPGRALMDPSCGDGRFLALAAEAGAGRLVACDISPEAIHATRRRLAGVVPHVEAVASDFFAVQPGDLEAVDAVVGNPPYIRYQRFRGESRRQALQSAMRLGVRLTQLTSSWAPFLLHAVQFLRPGGDLAMVVPAEIIRTHYGLATLRALLGQFGQVTLYAFEENLFTDAQEETCLLLAEGLGGSCREVRLVPLGSAADLGTGKASDQRSTSGVLIPVGEGVLVRFAEAFLSPAERRVWRRVRQQIGVRTVASLAVVSNGYVTGDNDFFHRRCVDATAEGYSPTWLFPVARSSRSLTGLFFTQQDIRDQEKRSFAHHLLVPQEDLFTEDHAGLARFKAEGERRGTPGRYKCRVRDPWWKVPGLTRAKSVLS
jgi:predicted RNA methylase